jgi:hypothetical protein
MNFVGDTTMAHFCLNFRPRKSLYKMKGETTNGNNQSGEGFTLPIGSHDLLQLMLIFM